MLTGILSTLLLACALLLVGYNPDSLLPPAETSTVGARLNAIVLDQEEIIEVSIEYHINKSAGSTRISYIGLEAFDTQIENIKATFNSTKMVLTPDLDQLKVVGQIDLPESLAQDTSFSFILSYDITNASQTGDDQFNFNIPLLWIASSSQAANKRFFEAHLDLPDGYYIKESFPSNTGPCSTTENAGQNCLNLQVLPTFLRVRGMIGHNPTFTTVKVLDYSVLVLLAVTCLFICIQLTKKQLLSVYNR